MTELPSGAPPYWEQAKTHLRSIDPIMAELIVEYEEPPLRSHGRLFETLTRAIVGQQISAKAADAIWGRFVKIVGKIIPENILPLDSETLRSVGLSRRKVEYIQHLAERGDWLTVQAWGDKTDEEVVKTLCTLRGIGPWTAEMMLIFTLMRPDVLPLGDIGVIRCIEKLYADGKRLQQSEITHLAKPWRPYRTVAVWYLWRHIDAEPVLY